MGYPAPTTVVYSAPAPGYGGGAPSAMVQSRAHEPIPHGAMCVGHQNDGGGHQYIGLAKTQWGLIPGKASIVGGKQLCHYAYGGKENHTEDFFWPVGKFALVDHVRAEREICGEQNDGAGKMWTAVANTPHGRIPGKAIGQVCWYPYGGKEHQTRDFQYVSRA